MLLPTDTIILTVDEARALVEEVKRGRSYDELKKLFSNPKRTKVWMELDRVVRTADQRLHNMTYPPEDC